MKSWLMSLLKTIDENPLEEREKQLTAVFFIILCLNKTFLIYYQYLSDPDVLLLIKMITLNPEPEKRSFPGYDFLKSCLLDERYVLLYSRKLSHGTNFAFLWIDLVLQK